VTRFGPELLGLLAVGLFVANMAAGKRSNEALAIKWARTFCGDGAVLERNFAQIIARADGGTEVCGAGSNPNLDPELLLSLTLNLNLTVTLSPSPRF